MASVPAPNGQQRHPHPIQPIQPVQPARAAQTTQSLTTVQVLRVTPASRDAVTLTLAVPGTQRAPAAYRPGQFITLAFSTAPNGTSGAKGTTLYRSYSLCGDGRADRPWEITVKRQNAGIVSSYLSANARPGMLLQATLPQGRFTLHSTVRPDRPIVFVAGGSGITPIYSMLRALARLAPAQRPRVLLHYAYHSPADAIYGSELAALDPQHQWLTQWHYIATNGHRLRVEEVLASLTTTGADISRAEWYICGPAGLKRNLEAALTNRGVPASRLHAEVFASPVTATSPAAKAGNATAARIRLNDSGAVLAARPGETILQTLERYGYRPDFNCRAGACGTCRLRLLAGQVQANAGRALTPAERAAGDILSCVAQPVGDVTLASAGRPVSAYAGNAASAIAMRRKSAKKRLRLGLVAATFGLFFTVWGFTSHKLVTQTTNSNTISPSDSNSSNDDGNATNSSNQNQSSSNSGSITIQQGQGGTNSSTGVS